MSPRIESLQAKKLIGHHLKVSLINNRTGELWAGFAPKIKSLKNRTSSDKISMQVYARDYFKSFNPNLEFEKWACVEVNNFDAVPAEISTFTLEGGLYAVFDHKGSSSDASIFHYIFSEWLPNSNYQLDNRPHFEILGKKYKNNTANSEEEIWIPIQL
ncbi:MAG: GyrI-like domain-containing protein [Flavobacteriales bacterium]|nr:GyrI-like domain-containing protein [Flavobacteriales bacterium]